MAENDLNFILAAALIVIIFLLFSRPRENFHFRGHSPEHFTLADRRIKALDPKICMCPSASN